MLKRCLRNVGFMIGATVVAILVLVALVGPYLVSWDPEEPALRETFQPPSDVHLLGTDDLGRDILARVVYGSRISLLTAAVVVLVGDGLGLLLGALAGYAGGLVDEIIMRVADVFQAFPSFLLAMAVAAALGPGLTNALLAVSFVWWPKFARLTRAAVLSVKGLEFVEAARASGQTDLRIMFRHILPNCWGPLIVQSSTDAGLAILITASLSFVGLGALPPTPEWGAMVALGARYIINSPWIPLFPGLAIALSVGGFMYLGDGLRDVLDPRLRGRIG